MIKIPSSVTEIGAKAFDRRYYNEPSSTFGFCRIFFDGTSEDFAKITYDVMSESGVAVLAVYDGAKLVECHSLPVTSNQTETSFDITTDNVLSGLKAKAFIWKSMNDMEPIGTVAEINVGN